MTDPAHQRLYDDTVELSAERTDSDPRRRIAFASLLAGYITLLQHPRLSPPPLLPHKPSLNTLFSINTLHNGPNQVSAIICADPLQHANLIL